MNKIIYYKNHVIILDGIVGKIYPDLSANSNYIYKMRFISYSEAQVIKKLKSFINLRINQLQKKSHVDIYA